MFILLVEAAKKLRPLRISILTLLVSIAVKNYVYEQIEYLLNSINDIASGVTTSAEANADVRDGAVEGDSEKESDDEQDDDTSIEEPNGNDLKGPPNQTLPRTNKDGKVIGDRTYGSDGKADVDTDYTDHGNPKQHPKVPHKHKWD